MKTEEEIKQEIDRLYRELNKCEDRNTCYAGMIFGQISALEWVLEESEEQ